MPQFVNRFFRFASLAAVVSVQSVFGAGPDELMTLLTGELNRAFGELSATALPPYYMCYRVEDEHETYIAATNGALQYAYERPAKRLTVQVRMGDYARDNFHDTPNVRAPQASAWNLPLDDNRHAVLRTLWMATNREYETAADTYRQIQAYMGHDAVPAASDADYTPAPPMESYDAPLSRHAAAFDMARWRTRLKQWSALFKAYPDIRQGTVTLSRRVLRCYFTSTEGVRIIENRLYAVLMLSASVVAEDGMEIPLTRTYFAQQAEGLPSDRCITEEIGRLAASLQALRTAPTIDPYSGPALLSGNAAGVFFHEIFGHRVEGQRMRSNADGQTFRSMVGEQLLPDEIQVSDDPTLSKYNGVPLYGHYKYDEEGTPAERVSIVENGTLHAFLMGRAPLDGFTRSNGHARAVAGRFPVSRQANLIVETASHRSREEMRQLLIAEARDQGKPFGLLFESVEGGFTNADKFQPSAFNVFPIEVYKVFTDGRPDELVRGIDIVGTPLSIFSSIAAAGGEPRIFTGLCGAESGSVPITAIAPDILVRKIEVQRKSRPPRTIPLLPRPY